MHMTHYPLSACSDSVLLKCIFSSDEIVSFLPNSTFPTLGSLPGVPVWPGIYTPTWQGHRTLCLKSPPHSYKGRHQLVQMTLRHREEGPEVAGECWYKGEMKGQEGAGGLP